MEDKNVLKEYLLKEVDIIQDIIKRLASNSFIIKGWTITLVVATLLFKGDKNQILIGFIPLIIFWGLDAYYLRQERMYRKLYEWVVKNRMNTSEYLFDVKIDRFEDEVESISKVAFSKTLLWLYGLLGILILIYFIFLFLVEKGGG